MSCSTCTLTKRLPLCLDNLTIGTITPETEVIIYFENLATGRIDYTTTTSDADGLLVADLSELSFAAKQAYMLTVVSPETDSIETPVEVTIGDNAYEYFQVEFKRIYEGESIAAFTDITLEVYE